MSYRPRSKTIAGKRAQLARRHAFRASSRFGTFARHVDHVHVATPDPENDRHKTQTVTLILISGAELKARLAPAQVTAVLKADPTMSFGFNGADGKEINLRAGAVLGARL